MATFENVDMVKNIERTERKNNDGDTGQDSVHILGNISDSFLSSPRCSGGR